MESVESGGSWVEVWVMPFGLGQAGIFGAGRDGGEGLGRTGGRWRGGVWVLETPIWLPDMCVCAL